jgi:hypothetical protein
MRRVPLLLAAAAATTLAVTPAWGAGGQSGLKLHPRGFGAHTYSSWKGDVGEADPQGGHQSLYFQKDVPTATPTAAVAVITGLEGTPASQLTGLAWEHKTGEHCGAGAPRWNINTVDSHGTSHTYFLGCGAASHARPAQEPVNWTSDDYPSGAPGDSLAAEIALQNGSSPGADETITGLLIVFDEGNDNPPLPPSVHLDNISVTANGVTKVWHSAADNGNG